MQWSVVGENEALLVQECGDTSALLVRKSALTCGFSDEGKLIALVEFLAVANLPACMAIFQAHALSVVIQGPERHLIADIEVQRAFWLYNQWCRKRIRNDRASLRTVCRKPGGGGKSCVPSVNRPLS